VRGVSVDLVQDRRKMPSASIRVLFEDCHLSVPVTAGTASTDTLEINVSNFSTLQYPTDNKGYV
jgi:hypothetical protein